MFIPISHKTQKLFLCVFFLVSFIFTSCASAILKKVDNTDNPSLKMVIARNMISQRRYATAREILNKIKEEFPNDAALNIEIDYEDAFIDFARKKYDLAKQKFDALITTYDNTNNNALPKWPYYLSTKLIEENINPILEKRAARKAKLNKNNSKNTQQE